MGNDVSPSSIINKDQHFLKDNIEQLQEGSSTYFGYYRVIKIRGKHQTFIKRTIFFQDKNTIKEFISEAQLIKETSFNLIYPKKIVQDQSIRDNQKLCSSPNSLTIFYPSYNKTLQQKIKQIQCKQGQIILGEGLLSQPKIWFLLNQLSRSLQILNQKKHCHWNILPQTIFQNKNQNWFIHDGYFVLGPNTQDFLQKKNQQKDFMSQQMKKKIQFGISSNYSNGIQQDIYCLGHCLIYAMSGIHPKDISKSCEIAYERQLKAMKIIDKNKLNYSKQLTNLIKRMISSQSRKRISIHQLRHILKQKQLSIIQQQERQYIQNSFRNQNSTKNSKLSQKNRNRQKNIYPQTNRVPTNRRQIFNFQQILSDTRQNNSMKSPHMRQHYHRNFTQEGEKYSQDDPNFCKSSYQTSKTVKKCLSPLNKYPYPYPQQYDPLRNTNLKDNNSLKNNNLNNTTNNMMSDFNDRICKTSKNCYFI